MGIVPKSPHSFKILFYLGGGLTAAVAVARLFFGESRQFIQAKSNAGGKLSGKVKVQRFMSDGKQVMKEYWKRSIYAVVMMALFNYMR
jgi:MFS transporter, SHS family, lactate transporter